MSKIYLIRHGEVHNPDKILYGRLPRYKLSKEGIQSIKDVGRKLKNQKISRIYTSPLLRARQTARIISEILGIKPEISRLITETGLIMGGKPLEEFRKIQPDMYGEEMLKKGQESIENQAKRMMKFVKKIVKKHPGENVLIVSHGDPIMILTAKIADIPFSFEFKRRNYLKTGKYIILEYQDGYFKWINSAS